MGTDLLQIFIQAAGGQTPEKYGQAPKMNGERRVQPGRISVSPMQKLVSLEVALMPLGAIASPLVSKAHLDFWWVDGLASG